MGTNPLAPIFKAADDAIRQSSREDRPSVRAKVVEELATLIENSSSNFEIWHGLVCFRANRQIDNGDAKKVVEFMQPLMQNDHPLSRSAKAQKIYVNALIETGLAVQAAEHLWRMMQPGEPLAEDSKAQGIYDRLMARDTPTPSSPAPASSLSRSELHPSVR